MNEQREDLNGILRAALEAIEPGCLVERALSESDICGRGIVWVIAAGKASPGMAVAAVRRLDPHVRGGLVVGTGGADIPPLECRVAGHPLPTKESEQAGRRALAIASSAAPDDCVLVLLSGGASALLSIPASGLTLEDKRDTTRVLLREGADIHALNTVRKHLSAIKGGWLAAASRAALHTIAVSDVVGDDVSVIGSGPTMPDPTTFRDALDIIQWFGGADAYPPAVVAHITSGTCGNLAETPKPGDERLHRSRTSIIANRRHAMRGAAAEARRRGYHVSVMDDAIVGGARHAGAAFAHREVASHSRPIGCVGQWPSAPSASGSGTNPKTSQGMNIVSNSGVVGRSSGTSS